ncbi:pilus assembly protein [Geomonas terrae]|uniref:Pilus assembly protein n=1 Tax=Geomonas terrae TaxID=2562681 RepID=A0A4S1CA41_9BACT|nr:MULTISPECIES: TadE/TadG family type IV pilus assembly protein [Geomonas]TGU70167.1 pilus assembly protein [Geomonas terrae]
MRNDKRGQALVELALVVVIVSLLGFAVIDLGWIFYANLTMQHAVREGARLAVTGSSDGAPSRRAALIAKIREQSMGLYDRNLHNPKDPKVSVLPRDVLAFANYTGAPVEDGGDPGEPNRLIMVSLTYTCPLLTPVLRPVFGPTYTFTARSTMRNEDFPLKEGK